ncbi:MAG: glycosyltransferase family 2 protein [Candidatus Aquicultor sp.]
MEKTPDKIIIIVPAYNEEKHIGGVLDILKNVSLIDEILVVSDGSRDKTAEVARSYNVRVIERETNGGKGAAMKTGIEATDADIIAFIDADLIGITPDHITDLIQPLLDNRELMMTVGKFTGGRLRTDLAQTIIPFISGQRAMRRELLTGLPDLESTGFGVEIAITQHAKQNNLKVEEVAFPDASQVMKEEKLGPIHGFKARLKMYSDIIKQLMTRKASRTKEPQPKKPPN